MPPLSLEERVAALEQQVAKLRSDQIDSNQTKPWIRTMGMFAGDDDMKAIFDEALKLREKDRERSRRRRSKQASPRRAKK